MNLSERKRIISELNQKLKSILNDPNNSPLVQNASRYNNWFTPQNVIKSIEGIVHYTADESIENWLKNYNIPDITKPKKVGLVLAGNIPLVGFHDILSVFLSGHCSLVKLSSDDKYLMLEIFNLLFEIDEKVKNYIQIAERLNDADAFIATGSNNSSRYFEYYFAKHPHIIRKSRNSVAILSGNESEEDFKQLANDIFPYFGLGCRNVSKLFVPENYDFKTFFESIEEFSDIFQHHKYKNNYDYNKSIYLINKVPHFDNGFLMLKEDNGFHSPISVVFYEKYPNLADLTLKLAENEEKIQCIVSNLENINTSVPFGKSQFPEADDYADGVDTLEFLLNLN